MARDKLRNLAVHNVLKNRDCRVAKNAPRNDIKGFFNSLLKAFRHGLTLIDTDRNQKKYFGLYPYASVVKICLWFPIVPLTLFKKLYIIIFIIPPRSLCKSNETSAKPLRS